MHILLEWEAVEQSHPTGRPVRRNSSGTLEGYGPSSWDVVLLLLDLGIESSGQHSGAKGLVIEAVKRMMKKTMVSLCLKKGEPFFQSRNYFYFSENIRNYEKQAEYLAISKAKYK